MSPERFTEVLRRELAGMPAQEIDEIVADYRAYFEEARAAGRSDDDVVAAHGDPRRLAQELRAETGFRRWEDRRSPRNFWHAALALGGLAAVDLVILIPGLLVLGIIVLILFFILSLIGVIGVGTLLDLIAGSRDPAGGSAAYLLLRSIGFLAASIGGGALAVFALRSGMSRLMRYARLHYRLLRSGDRSADPATGKSADETARSTGK